MPHCAGEQPVVGRALAGRGQRRHHARLQDAVARSDPATVRAADRGVERMGRDGDELADRARSGDSVAVERQHVAGVGPRRGKRAERRERRDVFSGEEAHEHFELAALAFPAHPAAFALVPRACAMQQQEARAIRGRIARVERADRFSGRRPAARRHRPR